MSTRASPPALVALVLVLVLVPASAEHVFSHRVYVVGRVVDSEGVPAPNVAVNVSFVDLLVGGACFDSKPERTNATGDYEVCRHAHVFPASATVTVRVAGLAETVAVDPDLRHAVASFRLAEPTSVHDVNGERVFARTFVVTGRAFTLLPAPEDAEGIRVNASPIAQAIGISIRAGDAVLASANATPNEHGLYRADLALGDVPEGALVRVGAGLEVSEEPASPVFRRADLNVVRDLRLLDGPGADAPGTSTPVPAWLVLAAGAIAMLVFRRRL